MPRPKKEFDEKLLYYLEEEAYQIRPISHLSVALKVSVSKMHKVAHEDGHQVQVAILKGEARRFADEENRYQRAYDSCYLGIPFQLGKEGNSLAPLTLASLSGIVKKYELFKADFRKYSLTCKLDLKAESSIEDKEQSTVSEIRQRILKALDKKAGISGRDNKDITFNIEHLKFLERRDEDKKELGREPLKLGKEGQDVQ